jgi:hypothetical protein
MSHRGTGKIQAFAFLSWLIPLRRVPPVTSGDKVILVPCQIKRDATKSASFLLLVLVCATQTAGSSYLQTYTDIGAPERKDYPASQTLREYEVVTFDREVEFVGSGFFFLA